jgi:hypothetical protein
VFSASASATLVGSSLGRLKLRRGAGQLAGLPAAALEVLDQVCSSELRVDVSA